MKYEAMKKHYITPFVEFEEVEGLCTNMEADSHGNFNDNVTTPGDDTNIPLGPNKGPGMGGEDEDAA